VVGTVLMHNGHMSQIRVVSRHMLREIISQ